MLMTDLSFPKSHEFADEAKASVLVASFLAAVVGFIVWGFLSGCIKDGANVFIDNEGLIKQLPSALSVHVYRLVWRQLLFLAHNMIIWLILVAVFNILSSLIMLVRAKTRDIAVVLIGHVTKEGTLAGPRVLEHVVDTVLMP